MSQICPRLGRGRLAPLGDLFDQTPNEMSSSRGKLADHVGDHVVLSPEGVVVVPSPETESSYPCPPQPLKHSECQNGDSTKPDFAPRSLPNAGVFQTNHHNISPP